MAEYMYTLKITRDEALTQTELNNLQTEILNNVEGAADANIQQVPSKESRFVIISDEDRYNFGSTGYIVYDNYTGVEYFISNDIHNKGNITPILNAQGEPLIYGDAPTPPTPNIYATQQWVSEQLANIIDGDNRNY